MGRMLNRRGDRAGEWVMRRMYVVAWGREDGVRKEGGTVNADPDEVLRAASALDHRRRGPLLQRANRPWGSENRSTKR